MERKRKLAKLIKLETEALDQAETTEQMLVLSQEIIRDARALADIIEEETKKVS